MRNNCIMSPTILSVVVLVLINEVLHPASVFFNRISLYFTSFILGDFIRS